VTKKGAGAFLQSELNCTLIAQIAQLTN